MLSLFTHLHVTLNVHEFLTSAKHKVRYFQKGPTVNITEVNGVQCCLVHREKKVVQVWKLHEGDDINFLFEWTIFLNMFCFASKVR